MIRLAEEIEKLFEQCDAHFPLNNSTIPLLVLIKTVRYELAGEALPLKVMCAELSASDLCTRLHITKLEKGGWLEVKTSRADGRVKLIKSTSRLMGAYKQLVRKLRPSGQALS